jgi:hypothetical protein
VAASIKHLGKYIVDNRRNESEQIEMTNPDVIEKMFFKISIDSLEYNTNAFGKLLIAVINHLKGNCTKHNDTIMGELGIAQRSVLNRKISELKNKGLVERDIWGGNKRRTLFLSKIVDTPSKIVDTQIQNSGHSESKIVDTQIQNSGHSNEESVEESIKENVKKNIEEKESTKENILDFFNLNNLILKELFPDTDLDKWKQRVFDGETSIEKISKTILYFQQKKKTKEETLNAKGSRLTAPKNKVIPTYQKEKITQQSEAKVVTDGYGVKCNHTDEELDELFNMIKP